jgi:hypothetical protein
MDNNNSFDWLAVQAQAPDKTFSDLYSMGATPDNTTLQAASFYKDSPKVQQMPQFKGTDGKFSEDKFDQYYLDAQKSLNTFKSSSYDLGNVTTDLWNDTGFARNNKLATRKNLVKISLNSDDPFTNLKTAQQSFYGLTEFNKWTTPKKSISEVAQGQLVKDAAGNSLGYTPEDHGGIFGFVRDPLVLAQYDDDIKDAKGNVIHKKGELKFDDKGLPFYETLGGRDIAGRQTLSAWNTLTKEDSFANKLDFMDDDGLDKSITGTIVKSVATLLPLAIGGPVSTAYQAYYIASNLLNATAQIGKSIDAILNDDAKDGNFYKWANTLQGYIGQNKTTMSEHGKQNMFSLENLANQAVDAVLMMKSQNSVFSWPTKIKQWQLAKELNVAEGSLYDAVKMAPEELEAVNNKIFDIKNYAAKYGMTEDAFTAFAKDQKAMENVAKYSDYMTTAYMAATMATGMSDVAKSAGLNDRDTGLLYLGYMGALAPFFRLGLAKWVEEGLAVDALAADMKEKTVEYAGKYLPQDLEDLASKLPSKTIKGNGIRLMAAGKKLGERISDVYSNIGNARKFMNPLWAGVAGGVEMGSIGAIRSSVQGIFNSLATAGLTSTKGNTKFDLKGDDILSEIGSEAFGGAFGGALFHVLEHTNQNHPTSPDLISYVINGHGDRVLDIIENLRTKGQLGSTTLSANPLKDLDGNSINDMWTPVNKDNPKSQNDFIADKMTKTVKIMQAINKANDVQDVNVTAQTKNQFYNDIVDTATDTDLRDQIRKTASDIYTLSTQLMQTPDSETDAVADQAKLKTELNEARTKLEYLQGDESLDEFFRQGLFNTRRDINVAFGVKNKDVIAKEVNKNARSYDSLSESDKKIVDDQYNTYKNNDGPGGLKADLFNARMEYDHFNTTMESKGYYNRLDLFKESMRGLEDYANIETRTYKDPEGNPISAVSEIGLQNDFLNKLKAIKYIPDFVYDKIAKRISSFQSEGADEFLKLFSPNPNTLKQSIGDNSRSIEAALDSPLLREYLQKRIGQKEFEEFASSDELKELKEKGTGASSYSFLSILKKLSHSDLDEKSAQLTGARHVVDSISEEDAYNLLTDPDGYLADHPDHQNLIDYINKTGIPAKLAEMENMGFDIDELLGDPRMPNVEPKDLVKNLMLINHISDTTGKEISASELAALVQEPSLRDNFIIGLTVDGYYASKGNVLNVSTIRRFDTSALDENVELAKSFNKERVKSPLREILESENAFLDAEYDTLNQVGYSNYLNRDEGFSDALDANIKAVKRVAALVEAAVTVNPLVNDFRKHNSAGLDTDLKNTELFAISSEDASYLKSELTTMLSRLQHLSDVNEYNKNNILAKLLKESGLDLAAKFQTLKSIATNPAVVELLPSLNDLFSLQNIADYANTYKTASNELKNQALYEIAKYEDSIYNDFQKLSADDKLKAINLTFKPVDAHSSEFYDVVDGDKPYNDFAQTIYLAKTYGGSSLDFYRRYAGGFDPETKKFSNIDKLPYAPFTNQEGAIRLADLLMNGDRSVTARLFNAYATEVNDAGIYNFDTPGVNTLSSHSTVTIWGDPGVGKTTAVLTGILNLMPEGRSDVLLLAPKERQVAGLKASTSKSGFEERVDANSSKVLREFMKTLNLKLRADGKLYDFESNDDKVSFPQPQGNEDPYYVTGKFRGLMYDEGKGIMESLDLFKDKSDSTYTLTDALVNQLGRYKVIAIDEYTHVNPIDSAILQKLVDLYNGSSTVQTDPSKRITIVQLGDVNQMGYIGKDGVRRSYTDIAVSIVAPPLTTSLRSGWDVINNTLVDLRNRAVKFNSMSLTELKNSDNLAANKLNPIRTSYYESAEEGNLGIKVLKKTGDTTASDIRFVTDNKSKMTGKDVVYIVNKAEDIPKAQALLRETLGDNWNMLADVYVPEEVQGGEYKYAIVEATPRLSDSKSSDSYNVKRVHEFLNTMLSRATEGTLFLNDGTVDEYVTFDSVKKDKVIRQSKLDAKTIDDIKNDKQELLAQILQDSTPKATLEGEKPSVEVRERRSMPVAPFSDVATLFEEPKTEPKAFKENPSDLISYNYYYTKADENAIFKLRFPDALAQDISLANNQKEVSKIINSYKYYLLHKAELGDRQISLKNNFQRLFDDNQYDWESPTFRIEVGKRGDEGMNAGRTELTNSANIKPDDITISLKVELPHLGGKEPLSLTMGFLNGIEKLAQSDAFKVNINGTPSNFFERLRGFVNENNDAPEQGQHMVAKGNNRWTSEPIKEEDFMSMAKIYGSRIIYDNAQSIEFSALRDNYFDFAFSDPQVVVANLIGENNKSILDPTNTNGDYKNVWDDLKGKSVAFISDVYELNSLSGKDMLNTYIKQLEYFGPESGFAAMDNRSKQEYIDELSDSIRLPSGLEVRYKPGLIKMVKLDNPRADFLNFRERFLATVSAKTYGAKMTPELLQRFNTSLYVKDRLVKSLLTLREFLKHESNRQWFQKNVIEGYTQRAEGWLEELYKDISTKFNNGEPVNRSELTLSDATHERLDPLTLKEFRQKLDDLLDPKAEESIYRGKYPTQVDNETGEDTNRKKYKADIDLNITASDLDLKLTGEKRKDFAGALIDLRLFNLFKRTRNANFAELIDSSLKALAGFKDKAEFRRFDLSEVFKDGLIEAVVLAQDDSTVDRESNVLATAIRTAGDFTVDIGRLTHPFYAIDFNKLYDHLNKTETPTENEVETKPIEPAIKPAKVIELNDVSDKATAEGPGHPVTVKDRLLEQIPELVDLTKFEDRLQPDSIQVDPLEATTDTAKYQVTLPDGSVYEMEYNMEKDTVKTTPINIAPEADPHAVLKNIEKGAMQDYDKMIDDMFGSNVSEPGVKEALDYYRDTFRHTMVSSNLISMNADFKLADYDAELARYSSDIATNEFNQHITDNRAALRPYTKQFRNISEYIQDYKPNIC